MILDNVHPSLEGNALLARRIAERMQRALPDRLPRVGGDALPPETAESALIATVPVSARRKAARGAAEFLFRHAIADPEIRQRAIELFREGLDGIAANEECFARLLHGMLLSHDGAAATAREVFVAAARCDRELLGKVKRLFPGMPEADPEALQRMFPGLRDAGFR
jgi:hypothetical protein